MVSLPIKCAIPLSCRSWIESFDHLVGAGEERRRNFEAKRPSGVEVDDQLYLGGLLDRQVGRLLAFENPPSVDAGLTIRVRDPAPVAHQAAGRGEFAKLVDRGHRMAERECGELAGSGDKERVGAADHERGCSQLHQGCEHRIEVAFGARMKHMELQPRARATTCKSFETAPARGLVGLTSRAMLVAVGTSSCASSRRFGATSTFNWVAPVTLPPGRLRLATRPSRTGSPSVVKTT